MFNFTRTRPLYFNKSLRDYCTMTTDESIRKLIEKYNLEKRTLKFKNILGNLDIDDPKIPEFNLYAFLIFLSISSISCYFYKRLK